jgi:hypothetical protein
MPPPPQWRADAQSPQQAGARRVGIFGVAPDWAGRASTPSRPFRDRRQVESKAASRGAALFTLGSVPGSGLPASLARRGRRGLTESDGGRPITVKRCTWRASQRTALSFCQLGRRQNILASAGQYGSHRSYQLPLFRGQSATSPRTHAELSASAPCSATSRRGGVAAGAVTAGAADFQDLDTGGNFAEGVGGVTTRSVQNRTLS